MQNIKECYDFVTKVWQFVKHTKAPAQDNNAEWEGIIDQVNQFVREFTKMMADWMEYLHDQSMKEGK